MTIKEAIHRIVAEKIKVQAQVGTITSVDESAMTCDAMVGDLEVFDIRLKSVIDNKDEGVLIVPKMGSKVLVGLIDNKIESSFIVGYSDVDKLRIICQEIELGGDEFGGLVKSENVADQINSLKNEINSLKNILNSWVPPVGAPDSGAALKAALIAWASPLSLVVKTDLENEKVKHG